MEHLIYIWKSNAVSSIKSLKTPSKEYFNPEDYGAHKSTSRDFVNPLWLGATFCNQKNRENTPQ